jgi:glycosyltransferase involved in cell wall biosynthesis
MAEPPISVVVVVPCFNEVDLIEPFLLALTRADAPTRIMLVDDGSDDGSSGLCASLAERFHPRVQAILLPVNVGKNAALRIAAARESADVLVTHDVDLAVDSAMIADVMQTFRETPRSFVYGSRFAAGRPKGMSFVRRRLNALLARWVSRLLRRGVTDVLCGLKAVPREAFLRMPVSNCRWGDLDIFFGAADQELAFHEVPAPAAARIAGKSKMRVFRHGLAFVHLCLKRAWFNRQFRTANQC